MIKPEDILARAKALLGTANEQLAYRDVVVNAYYSAYHAACIFEERLPLRSKAQAQKGSHDALLRRLECPDLQLDYTLSMISKDIDLPDFFGPIISGMMALHEKGRADEKEPIY